MTELGSSPALRDTTAAGPNVLVVDDVEANLIAVEALLEDLPCKVVRTQSGNDALRLLLKRDFAVMLLDVQMPGMDGYEVAQHARMDPGAREVPIIFLTATHGTEDNVMRGYGSGAVDFLFKPINPDILRSKVQIFLELYQSRQAIEQAHHELKATQAQLVQSAKMASLGELVAGVAHEINNPLAFVISHLNTAVRALDRVQSEAHQVSEESAEHLDRAQDRLREMTVGLERIRDLVLKLRTFSRLDEGQRKKVSVRECIDSVLTILNHRLQDRIQINVEVGQPEDLECFPGLLNQGIMNLVSNAIEAIEGRGVIGIFAGAEGTDYVLRISDTGPGISPGLRERVLEPFFTTKGIGEGTGLGLSITYSIAQKHGGVLELDASASGGMEATIRIPIDRKAER